MTVANRDLVRAQAAQALVHARAGRHRQGVQQLARARRIGAEAWVPKDRPDTLLPAVRRRAGAVTRVVDRRLSVLSLAAASSTLR